jgi:hypothetical protein
MADVLDVYAEPSDPTRPQGNCDETTKPRITETRPPLPAQPGRSPRDDDAYERHGTRHLLLCVEPQAGRRQGQVTAPRPQVDGAYAMPWWVDAGSPEATLMRVGLDNLHTHKLASLYTAFEPAEARRIARKLAWHDTPQHGRGLHRAELAWRVLPQQGLDRRIPDAATLTRESAAWEHQRNAEQATIDWRFAVPDARKKLKRLYPSLPS